MTSSQAITRNPSKFKKALIPSGIVLAGVAVFMLMGSFAPKPHKKEIIAKVPLVDVIEVSRGNVIFEIESQGSIVPRTETTLVSEVSGQIKKVSHKFVVGGYFQKGEHILEIDPISYEVALLQSQARLDGANAKLVEEKARGKQAEKEWGLTGRSKKNAPILALRKPQLQQALADVKAAEADVKNAEIKLQRTKITAPYDAMVKAKQVDIGQYVSTGTQLATTFAVDYAEIRLPIKEQDIAYIDVPSMNDQAQAGSQHVGSQVELSTFQGGKLKKWTTFITRSEGVVDASSRVNYVVAQINDPYGLLVNTEQSNLKTNNSKTINTETINNPLLIGTFVKATIIGIETDNIIAIPRKAVRDENKIYVLDENRKLDINQVDILRSDSKNIYISAGLKDQSKIVVTKLVTAVNGMKLRLKDDKDTELSQLNNTRMAAKKESIGKKAQSGETESESSESKKATESAKAGSDL
jgi:multidrug efflux system membrane fusion protein